MIDFERVRNFCKLHFISYRMSIFVYKFNTMNRIVSSTLVMLFLLVSTSKAQNCLVTFSYQQSNSQVNFLASNNVLFGNFFWDFGDGTTSTLANPSHAYSQAGTYYVCLTVSVPTTTGFMCTSNWCDSVIVGGTPPPPAPCSANFTYQSCNNSTITGNICFSSTTNSTASSYLWDFGDGTSSTLPNPSHGYSQPGTYYVCLTVNVIASNTGVVCTATWCDSVIVGSIPPPPVPCNANFSFQPCNNSTVTGSICFTGSPSTSFATYLWDFGDGTASTLANPSHVYQQPGTYNVCLTVTLPNSSGTVACTATWCDSIIVGSIPPPPVPCNANFSYQPCNNSTVAGSICFTGSPNTSFATYLWDFGDGTASTLANPSHVYQQPGTYNVCLTVNVIASNTGVVCTATWCDSVTVGNTPPLVNCNPNFTAQSCSTTTNTSSGVCFTSAPNPPGTIYMWNFGDGNSSNLPNPVHNYSAPGNYMVCLTVSIPGITGTIACTATWCNGVNAINTPVVNIYPNLVNESVDISIVNATTPVDFYLFNSMGLQISTQKGAENGAINFEGNTPKSGLYYYYFVENGNIINHGKLLIN